MRPKPVAILVFILSYAMLRIASAALGAVMTNPEVNVVDIAPGHRARIAVDKENRLHAVFEGLDAGSEESGIFYSQSSDGGKTWSAPKDISGPTRGASLHPDIAVEPGGALDVVWSDTLVGQITADIFFARSADGGMTFTQLIDISNTPGLSSAPAVATGPDNSIHVVWSDTADGAATRDIYYVYAADGARMFAKGQLLPGTNISHSKAIASDPAIAVGGDGRVHVAWLDTTSGPTRPDIYYVCCSKGRWSSITNVSDSARLSAYPGIAAGRERVYVSWLDYTKKERAPDIWCSIAGKDGIFDRPINVSDTPGVSSEPVAAADTVKHLVFAWADTTYGVNRSDIFCRVSTDAGREFSPVICLTGSDAISKHPAVAIVGDKVIALWDATTLGKTFLRAASMRIEGFPTCAAEPAQSIIRGKVSGK